MKIVMKILSDQSVEWMQCAVYYYFWHDRHIVQSRFHLFRCDSISRIGVCDKPMPLAVLHCVELGGKLRGQLWGRLGVS